MLTEQSQQIYGSASNNGRAIAKKVTTKQTKNSKLTYNTQTKQFENKV